MNEGGRPVNRPSPSSSTVAEFARHSGLALPLAYLELLRHANGGHPELDSIEPQNAPGASRWSVNRFFHLTDDKRGSESLWAALETWRPILGKAALPIANDGGGNLFFIDTTSNAVNICIHDDSFAIRELAPSFEEFIDRLSVDPDFI